MTDCVIIPAGRAVKCLTCGAYSDVTGNTCPSCAHKGLFNVDEALGIMQLSPERERLEEV